MGNYLQKYLSSRVFKREQLSLCFGTYLTDNQGHQSLFTAHSSHCFIVKQTLIFHPCMIGSDHWVQARLWVLPYCVCVYAGFGVDGAYVKVSNHLNSPAYCVSFTSWGGLGYAPNLHLLQAQMTNGHMFFGTGWTRKILMHCRFGVLHSCYITL